MYLEDMIGPILIGAAILVVLSLAAAGTQPGWQEN